MNSYCDGLTSSKNRNRTPKPTSSVRIWLCVQLFVFLCMLTFLVLHYSSGKITLDLLKQINNVTNRRPGSELVVTMPHSPRVMPSIRNMPIDLSELLTPEVREIKRVFEMYGYDLRIVGGAIRDLLQGHQYRDIDLTADATVSQMMTIFESENITILEMTRSFPGVKIRINNTKFEITEINRNYSSTMSQPHQKIIDKWYISALRRDFTVNSLSMSFDGKLHDYFNGLDDLNNGIVRFIGDPVAKMRGKNDKSIARYFKFYAKIAVQPDAHNASVLQAIRNNAHLLSGITGRYLWYQLVPIVSCKYSFEILRTMTQLDVTKYFGLPRKLNLSEFRAVYERSVGLNPQPATLVAALLANQSDVEHMKKRTGLWKKETDTWDFIVAHRNDVIGSEPDIYFRDIHANFKFEADKDRYLLCELLKYLGRYYKGCHVI